MDREPEDPEEVRKPDGFFCGLAECLVLASIDERAIQFCFFDFQLIAPEPSLKR